MEKIKILYADSDPKVMARFSLKAYFRRPNTMPNCLRRKNRDQKPIKL